MTITWRALPAVLLAVAALAPAVPATASYAHCSYYKWDAAADRWRRVYILQPKDGYEANHQQGVDYDCPYCWGDVGLPAQLVGTVPDPLYDLIETAEPALEQATDPVREITGPVHEVVENTLVALGLGNPFDGPPPPCPAVPPEWDAV